MDAQALMQRGPVRGTITASPADAAGCARMEHLPPEALQQIAAYFQALAEPTRLQILNLLRVQERNVGEIARLTGFTTPNVSRHLALLAREGLIERESRGNAAYYRIADPSIYALCDLVCGNIARQLERGAARVGGGGGFSRCRRHGRRCRRWRRRNPGRCWAW